LRKVYANLEDPVNSSVHVLVISLLMFFDNIEARLLFMQIILIMIFSTIMVFTKILRLVNVPY